MTKEKCDLRNLSLPALTALLTELGQPAFRARQVFAWVQRGAADFDEMTDLPKTLRETLATRCRIGRLTVLQRQESGTDGTRKYLFGLSDGNAIESVFMRYRYGNSACLSSQAGCRMGCTFCASGRQGLQRDLTPGEMLSQLLEMQADTGEPIGHVVVMGTGEPFDNYDNLAAFLHLIGQPEGLGLSMRHITVSTCGLVPVLARFGAEFPQVNLAVSLHAATNAVRDTMLPVNRRYPLEVLIPACRAYTEQTRRRITFEYTLVQGVNDRDADARQLAALLRGMRCHVNLILLNPVADTPYRTARRQRAEAFCAQLEELHIPATVRRSLGADIDAACGQLRLSRRERH